MIFKRLLITTALIAVGAGNTWATGLKSLEEFVKTVKTGTADFTQVVTSPPKDGQAPRVKKSSGQFEFSRPSRFKFTYVKPFAQTIVADGQTLWLYDQDLNQVTARQQSQVLGSTPAALIASAADLKALQADFDLADAPDEEGLEWVVATPTSKDGQLQTVRVGLKTSASGTPILEVLEILDSFGQRSVLSFGNFQVNPALSANAFTFKPPAGADVLKQ